MKGWLLVVQLKETMGRYIIGHLESLASIGILLSAICVSDLFLDIAKGHLLSIDKDACELTPLSLA